MTDSSFSPVTSIIDQMDEAIARIVERGLKPAAIYLTDADYKLFHEAATEHVRAANGTTTYVWPLAYNDVPLIGEKLIDHFEIPVRQRTQARHLRSTVYASNGAGFPLWLAEFIAE